MGIGENIKRIRTQKKMTQKELGEKLGGIPQQQIGRWENGKVTPKLTTLRKIATVLDVNINDLLENPTDSEYSNKLRLQVRKRMEDYSEHILEDCKNDPNLIEDIITTFEEILDLKEITSDTMSPIFSGLKPDTSDKVMKHTRNLVKIMIEILESTNGSEYTPHCSSAKTPPEEGGE